MSAERELPISTASNLQENDYIRVVDGGISKKMSFAEFFQFLTVQGGFASPLSITPLSMGGTGAITALAARENLGIVINSNIMAYDQDLVDISALDLTDGNFMVANGSTWVVENGPTVRTSLGLSIGVDVLSHSDGLVSIGALTTSADKMIYTTASNTYAVTGLTSAGRDLLDDATVSDQRTTLGLNIGTNIQPYLKHNNSATAAPQGTNDTTESYEVNSIWTDVTNDKSYICVDPASGAAIWTEITYGGEIPDAIYDINKSINGKPAAGDRILSMIAPRDIIVYNLLDDTALPVAAAENASSGTAVFEIHKNGEKFGDITFTNSTTGVVDLNPFRLNQGDKFSIVAPNPQNSSLSDISISVPGIIRPTQGGGDYDAAVLADNPDSYWKMDDFGLATTFVDSSGNGNHIPTVSMPAGSFRQSSLPIGSDASVEFSTGHGYLPGYSIRNFTAQTMEVWINIAGLPATYASIMGSGNNLGMNFSLALRPTGLLELNIYDGATSFIIDYPIVINRTYHVVATRGAISGRRLYVDGILAAEDPFTSGMDVRNDFIVGKHTSTGDQFNGRADQMAVYNTELSAIRVRAHYDAGIT